MNATGKTIGLDPEYYKGWHLGHSPHEAMTTEFEWAVLRYAQAFERFVMQIGSMSGMGELNFSELVILHVIGMQDQPKTASLIARQLNIDGVTNIQYALRKLIKARLVNKIKAARGKLHSYEITKKGAAAVTEYAHIRRVVLTEQTKHIGEIDRKLYEAAKMISMLTGVYDEAARIAATYSPVALTRAEPAEAKAGE